MGRLRLEKTMCLSSVRERLRSVTGKAESGSGARSNQFIGGTWT